MTVAETRIMSSMDKASSKYAFGVLTLKLED